MTKKTPIPGNKFAEYGRIYTDTTIEALQAHLTKLVRNQIPTMRSNPRYTAEIRRLSKAIEARIITRDFM